MDYNEMLSHIVPSGRTPGPKAHQATRAMMCSSGIYDVSRTNPSGLMFTNAVSSARTHLAPVKNFKYWVMEWSWYGHGQIGNHKK